MTVCGCELLLCRERGGKRERERERKKLTTHQTDSHTASTSFASGIEESQDSQTAQQCGGGTRTRCSRSRHTTFLAIGSSTRCTGSTIRRQPFLGVRSGAAAMAAATAAVARLPAQLHRPGFARGRRTPRGATIRSSSRGSGFSSTSRRWPGQTGRGGSSPLSTSVPTPGTDSALLSRKVRACSRTGIPKSLWPSSRRASIPLTRPRGNVEIGLSRTPPRSSEGRGRHPVLLLKARLFPSRQGSVDLRSHTSSIRRGSRRLCPSTLRCGRKRGSGTTLPGSTSSGRTRRTDDSWPRHFLHSWSFMSA